MSEVNGSHLESSVILRSLRVYFEPVVNFFKTKYVDTLSAEELAGRSGVQTQERIDVVVSREVAERRVSTNPYMLFSESVAVQKNQLKFEPPEGEVECVLAAIWQETLHIDTISRQDSFFGLGGDSLLLVRMFGEVRDRFQIELPLGALFNAPKLLEMASLIAHEKKFSRTETLEHKSEQASEISDQDAVSSVSEQKPFTINQTVVLLNLSELGPELLKSFVEDSLKNLTDLMPDLIGLAAEGDWDGCRSVAHLMEGISLSLGATSIEKLLRLIMSSEELTLVHKHHEWINELNSQICLLTEYYQREFPHIFSGNPRVSVA